MPGNGEQDQVVEAMAAIADRQETAGLLDVSTFSGNRADAKEAREFIRRIDYAQKTMGWNDKKTAEVAKMRMTANAKVWLQT